MMRPIEKAVSTGSIRAGGIRHTEKQYTYLRPRKSSHRSALRSRETAAFEEDCRLRRMFGLLGADGPEARRPKLG